MKTTLAWIRSFTPIDVEAKAFADGMTLSGSKVEKIERRGGELAGAKTGRICEINAHPNADRLVVCQVDVGDEQLVIATAATNVFAGAKVPVAVPGSHLSDGTVIKTSKLRGVRSEGMLLSIGEMGMKPEDYPAADPDGILILPPDTPVGLAVAELLHLDDLTIEFEITSNRVDCFSVEGLAREAAVTFGQPFKPLDTSFLATDPRPSAGLATIDIADQDLCHRYCGRVVSNVKIGPSPEWIQRRLRGAGMRPINNLVDITNYVMLELGQPMHAFDLDQLADQAILVRRAKQGEQLVTLDGVKRQLDPEMLVIADSAKAIALAGVMGGENSEIRPETTTILLESATFAAHSVRRTAQKLGLRTEASMLFSRGLPVEQAERALERACQLIEETGSGTVCQGVIDNWPCRREPVTIAFSPAGINSILGTDLAAAWLTECFTKLGIAVKEESDGLKAQIPYWRSDISCEADLAEEAARIYGYNKIEPRLTTGRQSRPGGYNERQSLLEKIKHLLSGAGFFEVITFSFESPRQLDKLRVPAGHPLRSQVIITNPLGEEFSSMRSSLIPSLLNVAATNWNRSVSEAAIYEIAPVYLAQSLPLEDLPLEISHLCGLTFSGTDNGADSFFALKGQLDELMRHLGIEQFEVIASEPEPWYHPGRCGQVCVGDNVIGTIGEIHPDVIKSFGAAPHCVVFDLDLDLLLPLARTKRYFQPLPRYPAIERDLSFLVKTSVTARELTRAIRQAGQDNLKSAELYDVYAGEQIQAGFQSVTYKLVFRDKEKTLTDADVNPLIGRIVARLEESFEAQLRA